jgi:hypothetical protein
MPSIRREIPLTPRARLYRKILGVTWVMSISAITLVLSSVASALMDAGFDPGRVAGKVILLNGLLLLGGGLMCWMSYRGSRRNLMPPAWGMVTLVALVWTAILVNRYA